MSDNAATVFVNYDKLSSVSELEQTYMELGRAYYEGRFEDPLPELLPLFDRITRLRNEQEITAGICPGCGNQLKPGAAFCGKCGVRLKR
ncbi:MAG: zinc ribbon domain-containing protein [Dorea sp.]|jgi:hypothetical protein|nr:zinc ribbon domain-containing protein [Dorea sp.]